MKWTIRRKILAGFGGVLILIVLNAALNWKAMNDSIAMAQLARDKGYAGAMLASSIRYDANQVWQWLTDISATRGAEGFDDGFNQAEHYASLFRQDAAALRALHPDNAATIDQVSSSFETFYEKGKWMAQQYIDGGPSLGNPAMAEFDAYGEDVTTKLNNLVVQMNLEAETSLEKAIKNNIQSRMFGVVVAIAVIGLAVAVAFFLAHFISVPVVAVAAAARRLAEGDIDQNIHVKSHDEIGMMADVFRDMVAYLKATAVVANQLADGDLTVQVQPRSERDALGHAFAQMLSSLRRLIEQVKESAGNVSLSSEQLASVAHQSAEAAGQVAATIQQVAKGIGQQSESITITATSVNEMQRAIDGVAKGAQEQAHSVAQSSAILNRLSESVHGIGEGAQEQTKGMQQALAESMRLAQALQQVNSVTEAVSSQTTQVAQTAVDGTSLAHQSVQGIQRVRNTTEQLAQRVRDLGKRSGQISAIIETIDDIAAQTNLLALNAAIEAARAGEHGKGFAVVADEVRKLAERSANATKEIAEMIGMVQNGASQVVDAMSRAGEEVSSTAELTERGGNSFQAIAEGAQLSVRRMIEARQAIEAMKLASVELEKAVAEAGLLAERNRSTATTMSNLNDTMVSSLDSVSAVVEENTAATEQMAASSNEVTQAIENIASVSEENSAAVEEVSAAAEEMSAQAEEVTASAQSLSQMAQELQTVVAQFKLSTETTVERQNIIKTFKRAHLDWVARAESMLAGNSIIHEYEVTSHTECALGRWYFGRGQHEWGRLPEFQAIDAPHRAAHESLVVLVRAYERGQNKVAATALTDLKRASQQVIDALDRLEQRVGHDMSAIELSQPARQFEISARNNGSH